MAASFRISSFIAGEPSGNGERLWLCGIFGIVPAEVTVWWTVCFEKWDSQSLSLRFTMGQGCVLLGRGSKADVRVLEDGGSFGSGYRARRYGLEFWRFAPGSSLRLRWSDGAGGGGFLGGSECCGRCGWGEHRDGAGTRRRGRPSYGVGVMALVRRTEAGGYTAANLRRYLRATSRSLGGGAAMCTGSRVSGWGSSRVSAWRATRSIKGFSGAFRF